MSCCFYLPGVWHSWALGVLGRAGLSQQILCWGQQSQAPHDGYQQSHGPQGGGGPAGSRASGTLGGREEDAEKGETYVVVPGWGKEELQLAETLGEARKQDEMQETSVLFLPPPGGRQAKRSLTPPPPNADDLGACPQIPRIPDSKVDQAQAKTKLRT